MPVTFKAERSHIQNSDGTYTVYIRLLKDRKKRMVNTGIRITAKAWNKSPKDKGTGLKEYISKKHMLADEYNQRIYSLVQKGEKAITAAEEKGETLQVDQLKAIMSGKDVQGSKSFIEWALHQIDIEYPIKKQVGNNKKYKTSVHLLKRSRNGQSECRPSECRPDVCFHEINLNLVNHFKNFLTDNYKPSYVKIKLNHIKRLVDIAIMHGRFENNNPFKYISPPNIPKKPKPVLSLSEIHLLENLPGLSASQKKAKDIFLWQLYMAGARIGDCLTCCIEDIRMLIDGSGNAMYRWEYTTRKSREHTNPRRLSVMLTPKAVAIYHQYKQERQTGYLFPYMDNSMKKEDQANAVKIKNKIDSYTGQINRSLRYIATKIKRVDRLSTHVARYTFRNLAKGDIEAIRDLLGHSSVQTTEIYGNQKEQNKLDEILKETWQ